MRYIVLKTLAFHLLFLVLHYAHELLPYDAVAVFAPTSETVFQHMKAAFYAWTLVSIGEMALRRDGWRRLFDASLLLNLLAPWAMFLWYAASALGVQPLSSVAVEVIYANAILLVAGLALSLLARDLIGVRFSRPARVMTLVFYGAYAWLFAALTFETPWGGFFVHP